MKFGNLKIAICLTLATIIISSHSVVALAVTQQDINNKKAQQQQAQALADQKAKEAAQVKNQIAVVDGQINDTQATLNKTNSDIATTQAAINDLGNQIKDQEVKLAAEKTKLNEVISNWYMEGNVGFFETLFSSDSLSAMVSKQQYYDSIKQQVVLAMNQINDLKAKLDAQKADQQKKMADLQSLQQQQLAYKKSVDSQKAQKVQILGMTQTQQQQYLALVTKYQKEISQLQSQMSRLRGTRSWGTQIVSGGGLSWYYSQLGNYTFLGGSPYTVNDYGCLVTSIAMVATYYDHSISPTDIATTYGSFSEDGSLLGVSGIGVSIGNSNPVDWSTVDSQINAGHPVIISVYLPSVGAINGDGSSHFVVVYGTSGSTYLMADPLGSGRGYNMDQVRSMKIVSP